MPASPHLRRATNSVLVAVALLGGAILLLGDRFDAAPGYALTQPVRTSGHIAACVAEESMRLIDTAWERCQPDELALASERTQSPGATGEAGPVGLPGPPGPPGSPGRPGADGVAGFELVTAKVSVPKGQSAGGEARCPAGKVALGGGVLARPREPAFRGVPGGTDGCGRVGAAPSGRRGRRWLRLEGHGEKHRLRATGAHGRGPLCGIALRLSPA